jgi:hypothetical protein
MKFSYGKLAVPVIWLLRERSITEFNSMREQLQALKPEELVDGLLRVRTRVHVAVSNHRQAEAGRNRAVKWRRKGAW